MGERLESSKHIPALDGVRGVAILLVFAFHFGGGVQSSNRFIHFTGLAVQAGWSGVTLFFILSGFLITGILWNSKGSEGWWKNFYIRRLLRISPLYYLSLLIVVCGAFWEGNGRLALAHIWVYALYLQNIPPFSVATINLGSPFLLFHFWSLAVEEQFYLLWPLLLVKARSTRQVQGLCGILFAGSLFFRLYGVHAGMPLGELAVLLPARMGELALGGFLAMAYLGAEWKILERLAIWVAAASFTGFILLAIALHTSVLVTSEELVLGVALASIFWAAFIVLALGGKSVSRAMSVGWLRWVGKISYGVYVYHVLLSELIRDLADKIAPHADRTQAAAMHGVIAVIVVFPLAWASFRFFESPIMQLKKKLHDGTGSAMRPAS
jgi:peptidoglycan/LPS O-acetylase OafA/YrhL